MIEVIRKNLYCLTERILAPRMSRESANPVSPVKQKSRNVLPRVAERAGNRDCPAYGLLVLHL
jgi:hypothetical protein